MFKKLNIKIHLKNLKSNLKSDIKSDIKPDSNFFFMLYSFANKWNLK